MIFPRRDYSPASYPGALIGFDEQRTSILARASRNQLAHQSARDEADYSPCRKPFAISET